MLIVLPWLQVLTEEFRLDYCNLWQSLIWTDLDRVKYYSQRLGAADLYPLFACMLTARSWASVKQGIGQAPVSATEVGDPLPDAWRLLPTQCLRFMIWAMCLCRRAVWEPYRVRRREESWHYGTGVRKAGEG